MSSPSESRAAIIQGDRSVLLEVEHPGYEAARAVLARFAELEKSPEHVHTYRVSDLALWNAAAAGASADEVVEGLRAISRFELPSIIEHEIRDRIGRFGVCALEDVAGDPSTLRLTIAERFVRDRLAGDKKVAALVRPDGSGFLLAAEHRGLIKQALLGIGYPVHDRAHLIAGSPLAIEARIDRFTPHPYQRKSVQAFVEAGSHGVVVLPCGAGKTVVAMLAMAELGVRTLVITTGQEAARQWRREILHKTTLGEDDVCLYAADRKDVGPVTITSYSMLARKGGTGPTKHTHFDRLASEGWGLVVYDEVHLLPAPVFRLTAELQARRRLGLTATLIREDGREGDVFALIGPKRYDVPWRELEKSGHIATAVCFELRVALAEKERLRYATATPREQPRIAGENPDKIDVLARIVERHAGDRVLVIGSYLDPLADAAQRIGAPVITGETPQRDREKFYAAFRAGGIRRLVLSRVGNFAIDLPEANVLVQISGTMGSRQEEAQRLGRILRPKPGGATFYTLVTRDTVEQEQALHRQLFLTEQGYRYFIEDTGDGAEETPGRAGGPTLH